MLNQKKYFVFAASMLALLLLVGFSLYEKSSGTIHEIKNNSASGSLSSASDSFDVEIGTIYTCSMHPEVLQNYPGKCPKCKMKLDKADDQTQTIDGNVYSCSMHPEVRANYEGTCPVCKMKLEKIN